MLFQGSGVRVFICDQCVKQFAGSPGLEEKKDHSDPAGTDLNCSFCHRNLPAGQMSLSAAKEKTELDAVCICHDCVARCHQRTLKTKEMQ
jgi:hypothetical protein